MLTKTRAVNAVFLILWIALGAVHSGCSNSGKAESPASADTSTIRMTLSTTTGFTAIVADGRSTIPIRIQVTNGSGNAVAGLPVTFATDAGTLAPSVVVRTAREAAPATLTARPRIEADERLTVTTDTNGLAQVLLTSSIFAGFATVTADITSNGQNFRTNIVIFFAPGPPARVDLSASPASVSATASAMLTAIVTDVNGNPTPGEMVMFTLSTNTSGGSLTTSNQETDANGRATVTYTAGITQGTDTVRAQVVRNSVSGSTSITVTAPSGPTGQVTSINVVSGALSIPADGRTPVAIQATVMGTSGPLAGIPVSFTTTAGTLSSGAGATGQTASATTGTTGVAAVSLIAATSLGAATVTATAGGFRASVAVTFVAGTPARISLTSTPATVVIGGTATVRAMIEDANGNPVAGQTLVFSVLPASTSGGTLTPLSGVTDANGRLTVAYTASAVAGTDTIQARATNGMMGTLPLQVTPVAGVTRIDLLVSSPQLGSNGTGNVTLTALVRNAANNVVSNVPVNFAADSGGVQVINGTTDTTGTASALLTTGGDQNNRVITVTARTGNLVSTNTVQVTGTTLTISGANTSVLGGRATLTILLRDSGGVGIPNEQVSISSTLGNMLSASTVMTDSTGQASVEVTARVPGNDTIQVAALGATASSRLSISADNFVFSTLPAANQVALQQLGVITVHWDRNGTNQVGQTLTFSLTRGSFSASLPCPTTPVSTTTAVTDGSGNATVTICSDNAGPSAISASAGSAGPSAQVSLAFVAETPAAIVLQAAPTTVGVNAPGTTTQQSVITAVVRDSAGNLVANRQVTFSLTDVSGGQIFPAAATTDSFGRASTIYTAGSSPSAQDGVVITAAVGGISSQVTLTVARQALFVTLGTGNQILIPSNTTTLYSQPYSGLVNDANGNPISNATIELNVRATRYQKGFYSPFFNSNGACIGWGKVLSVRGTADPDDGDQACDNEDRNQNGILDTGEDLNNNTSLDPRIVVSVPQTVTTDATGFAFFDVTYAREFTWVEIELEARAAVQGSEASARARFFLRGIASDFSDCEVSPPGQVSPFGLATTCGCDERTDPGTCPVFTGANPVTLTTSSTTLPAAGGTFNFTVSGGSQSSYNLSTTLGTLSTLSVAFGNSFALTLNPNTSTTTSLSITVTARDAVTGQNGTITLTQLP